MRLTTDQLGTAYLEALIAIPVLAVVLAGVVALNAIYSAKLEAKARARRLAWLQADSGECPTRTCAHDDCKAIEAQLEANNAAALHSVQAGKFSLDRFLGELRDFFIGRVTIGEGAAHASLPKLLGGDRAHQRGATILLCNTTPRQVNASESILDDACATGLETTEYAREVCR